MMGLTNSKRLDQWLVPAFPWHLKQDWLPLEIRKSVLRQFLPAKPASGTGHRGCVLATGWSILCCGFHVVTQMPNTPLTPISSNLSASYLANTPTRRCFKHSNRKARAKQNLNKPLPLRWLSLQWTQAVWKGFNLWLFKAKVPLTLWFHSLAPQPASLNSEEWWKPEVCLSLPAPSLEASWYSLAGKPCANGSALAWARKCTTVLFQRETGRKQHLEALGEKLSWDNDLSQTDCTLLFLS